MGKRYCLDTTVGYEAKGGELTCVIGFRNEGVEVENTVRSIRATTAVEVPIVLVDDGSDDGFDYGSVALRYGCRLIRNAVSVGPGVARQIGAMAAETPYFVTLDGHMRFYHRGWDLMLTQALMDNPKSVICSNSIEMWRREDGSIDNEDGKVGRDVFGSYGAVINADEPGWELTAKWNKTRVCDDDLMEVPAVMGAVYASSRAWLDYTLGFRGLRGWGNDEGWLSLKTWLLGGRCFILRRWGVGHLYRDRAPYRTKRCDILCNYLLPVLTLVRVAEWRGRILNNYKEGWGEAMFNEAMDILRCDDEVERARLYMEVHETRSLEWFLNEVNARYL